MSETDPYHEDDATEIASVLRTFRQINENIETLNRNLDESTGTLGALIKTEYAGELARLRESVDNLVQKQDALAKTVDEKQKAVQDLHDASRSLQGQDVKLAGVTRDLEALGQEMDEIVARPASQAEQRANLRMWTAIGFLSCLLLAFGWLWALPDRGEIAVARMIMGGNHWDAAWRMIEAHDPGRSQTLGVLTWIDESPEEAEKHEACRDKAWESGEYQECTVLFEPKK